jgi:tetratricopeptide (TPR) repeat protein
MNLDFSKDQEKIEKFITDCNYEEAVTQSFKILEKCLLELFNSHFTNLSVDKQQKIIERIQSEFKGKKFEKLMIGEKLRIFEDFDLLSDMNIHAAKDLNTKTLLQLTDLRNESTHPTNKEISKGDATKAYSIILRFLEFIGCETSSIKKPESIKGKNNENKTLHNLPKRDYIEFIGREDKLQDIKRKLLHPKVHVLSIDGIGGVGKTALALELSYGLADENIFKAIIWVSAKKNKLTRNGVVDIDVGLINLEFIFDEILKIFGKYDFQKYASFDSKKMCISNILREYNCLIVVDNLETIEDKNLIDFIIDIDFPMESKVLITSRKRIGQIEWVEYLDIFSLEETKKYIITQLKARNYFVPISESAIRDIHAKTGGLPLAIRVVIPWIIDGKIGIGQTFIKDIDEETDILQFCFSKVYNDLLSEKERRLFCVISIAPSEINDSALKYISSLSDEDYINTIIKLQNYSLITSIPSNEDDSYEYKLLPLTKEFGQKMSIKDFPKLMEETNYSYLKYLNKIEAENKISKTSLAVDRAKEAKMLASKGDIEGAKSIFKIAQEYDDKCDFVYYLSAQFCRGINELSQARSLIKKALKINDQIYYYWIEYSIIEETSGNFKNAESILEAANKKLPKDMHIVHKLIMIKSKLQKNNSALSYAENNLIYSPKSSEDYLTNTLFAIAIAEANWRISFSIRETGEFEKAEECLKQSVEKIEDLFDRKLLVETDKKLIWQLKKAYGKLAEYAKGLNDLDRQRYFTNKEEYYTSIS